MFEEYMNFMNDIANDIAVTNDDLLLEWLTPYGITKDNYIDYIPRILIEEIGDDGTQHWYLDGKYIFSIGKVYDWSRSDDGLNWSCTLTYRKFQRTKERDPEQED